MNDVDETMANNGNGFTLHDLLGGRELELQLVHIHSPEENVEKQMRSSVMKAPKEQ